MPKEKVLVKKIKDWMREQGAYCIKYHGGGFSQKGVPDLLVSFPPDGVFIGIETKAPGKKPTLSQLHNMKKIRAAGGVSFSCDTFEDFLKHMKACGLL